MSLYYLFIDELGLSSLKAKESGIYILTGIAVKKENRDYLKILSDQIKYKYWGHTNIVFHSRKIGRNLDEYKKFSEDYQLKQSFIRDLIQYLSKSPITAFSVVVDKKEATKQHWNEIKIIKETIRLLYFNYLTFLLGKSGNGKIVVESAASEKEVYYLKYFAYYISPSSREFGVDYRKIQEILTSVSFVTKRNYDIEEQIADLFSYAGKCKYLQEVEKEKFNSDSYEAKIL